MSLFGRIKESWDDFIRRSGEANKEMFGDGVPDCCKMNNQTKPEGSAASQKDARRN